MTEELKQLLNHLVDEEGKHVIADIGEDGNLSHITILDLKFAPSGYAHDSLMQSVQLQFSVCSSMLPYNSTRPEDFIQNIHPRWLRLHPAARPPRTEVRITHSGRPVIQNSHNLYAVLGQFTPFYGKHPDVTAIFNRTLQELQATQVNVNNGMPPTIAQGGRAFTTPSKNVICGGRPKTKKTYKCSICGSTQHTSSFHK